MSLVSIIVSSFNSSAFIIEALDSIFSQTWQNIEIIITDDCSEDNTLEICREWINKNKLRFIDAKILSSNKNTGIAANANRGLNAARGSWIKFIGADDSLKANCIEDNLTFIWLNPQVKILFSRIEIYKDSFEPQNLIETTPGLPYDQNGIMAYGRSAYAQYKMLLVCDRIHFSPSVFIQRETLVSVGGFDERFKMIEDYPLWLKLTKLGHKLYLMHKVTVNYRKHSGAINNSDVEYLIKPNYFRTENFRRIYVYPYLPADIRLEQRFTWYSSQVFRFDILNRNRKLNKYLLYFLTKILNPFKYLIYMRKLSDKRLRNDEFYQ